ncbi:MAG: helix-turn-helix domain-containing protein [Nitrososphaerales archaeon]|nr:helix-turn-helix domain-containing protein [Nitrososphaerales archaeon]MCX8191844.1 helix-turn-helix domain-containing protein [Nitrososphaerales archaeon]
MPAEVETRIMLPILRATVAKRLMTEQRMTQQQVAKILGLTQAAISNYIRNVRGLTFGLEDSEGIKVATSYIVEKLLEGTDRRTIIYAFNDAVRYIKRNKILCHLHKRLEPEVDVDNCRICCELM